MRGLAQLALPCKHRAAAVVGALIFSAPSPGLFFFSARAFLAQCVNHLSYISQRRSSGAGISSAIAVALSRFSQFSSQQQQRVRYFLERLRSNQILHASGLCHIGEAPSFRKRGKRGPASPVLHPARARKGGRGDRPLPHCN